MGLDAGIRHCERAYEFAYHAFNRRGHLAYDEELAHAVKELAIQCWEHRVQPDVVLERLTRDIRELGRPLRLNATTLRKLAACYAERVSHERADPLDIAFVFGAELETFLSVMTAFQQAFPDRTEAEAFEHAARQARPDLVYTLALRQGLHQIAAKYLAEKLWWSRTNPARDKHIQGVLALEKETSA